MADLNQNGGGQNQNGGQQPQSQTQQNQNGGGQQAAFDYDKLAQLITGRTSAAEDAALKGYFKQQGLSQQEAEQAMAAFKAEKQKNQPNVGAMQQELADAKQRAQEADIKTAATLAAVGLGIDPKTVPYILKMADMTGVMDADGKLNEENVKNAINKVLEDVPALKPSNAGNAGFMQVGAGGNSNNQQQTNEDALKKAFGL